MAMNGNTLGDAMLAAIDAEAPRADGESMTDYRRRLKRAEASAIVAHIQANARVTVNPVVAAGIPVTVAIPAGTGVTTAPGSSTDTAGTIL